MKVAKLKLGIIMQTGCYVAELENKEAVAIDINDEPEKLLDFLEKNNLKLKKILLTHGHFDHILGVEKVRRETGAEVYIHTLDAPKLSDLNKNLGAGFGIRNFEPVSEFNEVSDGDIIKQGETEFKVMHTPGHTMGGVCYIADDVIFSGDTLFRYSMGRTDFPDSNSLMMVESLKKLKNLEGNYKVCPGHNTETMLDDERKNNPYMRQL